MNRRTIAILIFVVAILILSVVGVLYIMQQNAGSSQQAQGDGTVPAEADQAPSDGVSSDQGAESAEPLPDMVEVVVSLQTLPRGWQLTENELTTDLRLVSEVGSNVITRIEDAVGLYARTDIFQGETLTFDALINDPTILGQNEYGPSSLIPPGFVAAALPMDRLSGVGYSLSEGDDIDILISFYIYRIDEQFQTYLSNASQVYLVDENGEEIVVLVSPYGRYEEIATGDTAHIAPREFQRPVLVSMVLQNAKVIQVGPWTPPEAVQGPTPTPEPIEGDATPTPGPPPPTATPFPNVLVVAMSPQQQLFLKYATESKANIDFALRSAQDNQLYSVESVDLNYLRARFGIDIPPNFNYSVDPVIETEDVTPTPAAQPNLDNGENS
ncbi:MAG: hypothetical protein KC415_19425 [Anaerolineales bacterium]|nr:hypothetical protein [Anaerolineales bacterium]